MPDQVAAPSEIPAVRSLLAPSALAKVVGAAYGLTDVRCRLVKATIRDVYRVDARSGPAILIVYRHDRRTEAEITAELDLLDDLAERGPGVGVAVAPALRTINGARVLTLTAPEGVRHAALFRFVEGDQMERNPPPETARQLGQVIARLHGLTDSWLERTPGARARAPLDARLLVDGSLTQIERFLQERPTDLAALRRAARWLRRRIDALSQEPPGYGFVHGDVIPTNVLMGSNSQLTLLDFDFCGPGWRVFDVATYLHGASDERTIAPSGPAFLAGYQDIRPLLDWELGAIPLFIAVRELFRLGNWGWRIEEWGTSALPTETLDRHLRGINEAVRQLC